MSKIVDAHFKASDHDIQQGKVWVFYSNGGSEDFDGIDRGQFHQWAAEGYDPLRAPSGIRVASSAIDEASLPSLNTVDEDSDSDSDSELRKRRARIQKINEGFYYDKPQRRWIWIG